ncbi:hypothetical protein D3C85_1320530 [compost metagenome]
MTFRFSIPVPLRAVTHLPPLGRAGSQTSAYLALAAKRSMCAREAWLPVSSSGTTRKSTGSCVAPGRATPARAVSAR